MRENEVQSADQVQQLRRSLRDVVALSMLPSVWAGYEPQQICTDVVDVVARMIGADGVYLLARRNASAEILRLLHIGDDETERELRRASTGPIGTEVRTEASPGSALRILTCGLSFGSADRLVVAARRADFPRESEKLLVRIAANQLSMWLEWKSAQSALSAESAFRRAIEESILAGVAVVDANGRQTYVNRAFVRMVGWDEADLIGAVPPFPYWAPEDRDNITAALREVISGRANPAGYELVFRRSNGARWDALVLISELEKPDGRTGFLACVYDITERKATERAAQFLAEAGDMLNRSLDYEETLRSISTLAVPRLADWCFVDLVEPDGAFRRIGVAHANPAHEPIARRLERTYFPKDAPYGTSRTFAEGRTMIVNEVPRDILVGFSRDEDHLDALLSIGIRCFVSVPMTSRGKTFGVITFIGADSRMRFDPREVQLAEELARRAALAVDNARLYRDAQEANRAKDEFLANLSHELRTPMTAILGWAHLLQVGSLDPDQVRLGLDTIRQSGEAQARLIDDLLDVSRIVTGKLHLDPRPVPLGDVLQRAVAAARPAIAAKRQSLELAIGDTDATVLGDADRLQQVFWNLLSNAVKFTPPGGSIRARLLESDPENVQVIVEDNGEGIPPEFLPLVFERFRQVATVARGRTGLGLGLAITKELVEIHGGSIEAQSEGLGRGARFIVTLPRQRAEMELPMPADLEVQPRERLRSLRVLLVEGDESTRTLLATILRSSGAEVMGTSCAADAEAALAQCDPQILVTDVEIPDMDGITLLHRLRARANPRLPAIAITAYADAGTRERIRAAGFNGVVAKPFDPIELADEILRALTPEG